ncbi:MAG: hypothetical protein NWF00_10415 [Candidatus Bathyarchaeota archaeon]|nr:hypothetical protein [Candidatus Bathyarchaeota archaeon]
MKPNSLPRSKAAKSVSTSRESPLRNVTVKGLSAMEKQTENAAQLLKDAAVEAVTFACTSDSLIKGVGHDATIAKKSLRLPSAP